MGNEMSESNVVELTGKIMLVAVVVLFTVLILVFFLHLYTKWFWSRSDHNSRRPSGIGAGHQHLRAVHHGLDPSVLKSIPAVIFSQQDGIECAVCLSQVSEGEKGRFLPKCKHGFHVECIDMWFQSHSTCPICRNPLSNLVLPSSEEARIEIPPPPQEPEVEVEVPLTNIASFLGNESRVGAIELPSTSASTGETVIEIPNRMNHKQQHEQDSKSPSTPTPRRMASFKRLFISSS